MKWITLEGLPAYLERPSKVYIEAFGKTLQSLDQSFTDGRSSKVDNFVRSPPPNLERPSKVYIDLERASKV